jgi:hypothetical protein
MDPQVSIRVENSDLGTHPEARQLNDSFRDNLPILKLRVDVEWQPAEPRRALAELEAQLVKLCPSLRMHQCRGEDDYHVLRHIPTGAAEPRQAERPIEPALALAHLLEHVMIDTVSFVTDAPIVSGATAALRGSRTRFDVFVEVPDPVVARLTLALATDWLGALMTGAGLDGSGQVARELVRDLYRRQPDAVEPRIMAQRLGWGESLVRHGLAWLEQRGLVQRIAYTMNFSGLSYYRLDGADEQPEAAAT